eukprot:TRINITY_DN18026_c0_g1_i1.p1 TRINITY_DN18026_c0_g1~~TRINITY_DN18026_c0_g1_i1.p1  ORF type:complete len:205 (-),score=51.31 TRINITY_DN18026_c0_g1_i1:37-615(-)
MSDRMAANETCFTHKQIAALRRKFMHLTAGTGHKLTLELFGEALKSVGFEQDEQQVLNRLFAVFDRDHSGSIDLREFTCGLSVLSGASTREFCAFAFEVYDADHDGSINLEELRTMLTALASTIKQENPAHAEMVSTPEAIDKYARLIMDTYDSDQNGVLTSGEFVNACLTHPDLVRFHATHRTPGTGNSIQ